MIEIMQINCGIFRHGIYKENGQQIGPHSSKELCDQAFSNGLIYGCGKPFSITKNPANPNVFIVAICDYI